MKKYCFFRNLREKILSVILVSSMVSSVIQPLLITNASVIDGPGNTISGANGNFVNLSNSGAYQVRFSLSGTLDPSDTILLTATNSSGSTATGVYLSASGGESSGSVLLNFNSGGWNEGQLSFSGVVYSGGIVSQVVASGITLTGTLDITSPGIVLSSSAPSTISGSISVNATTSETATGFTIGDLSLTNATATGFSQTGSTGYTFTVIPTVSTGTVTISVGSGTFSDMAGNPNNVSNILSFNTIDTISPIITITSHASGAIVSGFPTFTGSVTDSGGIASIFVNGFAATFGSGIWSKTIYDLVGGLNTVTAVATDTSGNIGTTSILLNRVSFPFNTNVELSGTTSAVITFNTDLSATGVVLYGTGLSSLNSSVTGSTFSTSHSFTLTGLLPNTIYYFAVLGQGGDQSPTMHFKTPTVFDIVTASGSITATSSVYLSGSSATGATFSLSGSLGILSLTSSGSSLSIPFSGLTIIASGASWDGVLQAPELTSDPVNLSLSGYAFTGTFYQIGNANTELTFSGQSATVTVRLGSSLSGQAVRIFRSPDRGVTYMEILPTCTVNGSGDCTFVTNQLSRFAFAVPADVTPDAFSFSGVTGAELSTQYVSNPITLTGITGQTAVSITGGEYSINNEPFTTLTGAANSGDTIVLRLMSSASNSTSTNAVLNAGGVSSTFTVTTKAATGGGGGGSGGGTSSGGGGGGGLSIDNCPSGDTSPSYYDGKCGTSQGGTTTTTTTTTTTIPSIFTGSVFHIPPIIITNLADIDFVDIGENWAQFYIIRLVIRGIIDNVKFYRPDDSLTRAEFLKIVINSAGWQVPTGQLSIPFDDVPSNIWYAPYVSLALSKGMITGTRIHFDPNDQITRAEAAKILMTAPGVQINEPNNIIFRDLDPTSDLNKYIEVARSMGILSGQIINGELRFRPNDAITRAEIAKIVVNAFHL